MSNKIQWMAWEKYTGRVIAVANSYEALMRRGAAIRAACIGKSDYLPAWARRTWRKGDTLPMYRGQVVDRMTGAIVHETTTRTTWEDAQKAAEAAAKRKYRGDRYAVRVA